MGYLNIFLPENDFHYKQDIHFWGMSFTKNEKSIKNINYLKKLCRFTSDMFFSKQNSKLITWKRIIKLNKKELKNIELNNLLDIYNYKMYKYYDSMFLIFIKLFLTKSKKKSLFILLWWTRR